MKQQAHIRRLALTMVTVLGLETEMMTVLMKATPLASQTEMAMAMRAEIVREIVLAVKTGLAFFSSSP